MRIEQSEFHDLLVRGLTHKMNNILSLFHGYLGLLIEDKKLDPETMDGLIHIRQSADAAARLMERTKTLATPPAAVWRHIPPEDFFRPLLPAFQSFADRDVSIQLTCEPALPNLFADTARLRIALKEIVKNACEASPPGGLVQIHVKRHIRPIRKRKPGRRPSASPMYWTAITVTDSGKGIPESHTTKIFQPFFSTKQKRDAMGLGLSVALGLIQQLGGVIRLQSKPGKTSVKVLLPARAT